MDQQPTAHQNPVSVSSWLAGEECYGRVRILHVCR